MTLVKRVTGCVLTSRLSARTKEQASVATKQAIAGMRSRLKALVLDHGTEFHGYEEVERKFDLPIYFATPYHSRERGTNEDTNGLMRKYLPKGTDLKDLTQSNCNWPAKKLNTKSGRRLNH
jgi:IS30 family transposase